MEKMGVLSIKIRMESDYSLITVRGVSGEQILIKSLVGRNQLSDLRRTIDVGLKEFKRLVGNSLNIRKFAKLNHAMDKLHRTGKFFFFNLFANNSPQIYQALLRYLKPRLYHGFSPEQPPAIIELDCELSDFLPLEFLVLPSLQKLTIATVDDLEKAAMLVLGFSFVVNRTSSRFPLSHKARLENWPKLPIKFFADMSLKGVQSELKLFKWNNTLFDLDGPWPTVRIQSFEEKLAFHLWHPHLNFQNSPKDKIDQVHHLSCHCDTSHPLSAYHCLSLTCDQKVMIRDLEAKFLDFSIFSSRRQDLPLIFLNACSSSRLDPDSVTSFPELFLFKNKNCGFLGNETVVPDEVAQIFTKMFYFFLLRGCNLSTAIHLARWMLLRRYKNPLGILYTLFGNPDMRVRKPVQLTFH